MRRLRQHAAVPAADGAFAKHVCDYMSRWMVCRFVRHKWNLHSLRQHLCDVLDIGDALSDVSIDTVVGQQQRVSVV